MSIDAFWRLQEEEFFSNMGKPKKPSVDYGAMGPNHPGWKDMLWETEHMLQQAGRVYDQNTIEAIAQDEKAWDELSKEAIANMSKKAEVARFQALTDTLGRIRSEAKSQKRLDDLFGGDTQIR